MRKKIRAVISIIGILFVVFALFIYEDKVQEELVVYLNDHFSSYQIQESELYQSLYDDFTSLEEIEQNTNDFFAELRALELETEEVQELHNVYVKSVELMFGTYADIDGIFDYKSNDEILAEYNAGMDLYNDVFIDLMYDIATDHDVYYETTHIDGSTNGSVTYEAETGNNLLNILNGW
ncbi:hypothetical protein [Longirhabdus pacifica]|uniref:hypothetical protein n=1 Tax=Longirhabdus pacifica TaxID=2305227 RepID=UPI0010092CA5|nr:hypothetical protein [Longirhabdus pacifica]